MGLDNGITMRSKIPIEVPCELVRVSESICSAYDKNYTFEYELCYWRKCWNIRHGIGMALGTNLGEDASKDRLDIGDVKNIWHVLNHLNNKRTWDSGDSIWTYKEMRDNLDCSLLTLEWVIYLMRNYSQLFKDGCICVEFYDSY